MLILSPFWPFLSLPGADLDELGRKGYVIATERGEMGEVDTSGVSCCARPREELALGIDPPARFSLQDPLNMDGRLTKEVPLPQLAAWKCTSQVRPLLLWSDPVSPQNASPGKEAWHSSSDLCDPARALCTRLCEAMWLGQPQVPVRARGGALQGA